MGRSGAGATTMVDRATGLNQNLGHASCITHVKDQRILHICLIIRFLLIASIIVQVKLANNSKMMSVIKTATLKQPKLPIYRETTLAIQKSV